MEAYLKPCWPAVVCVIWTPLASFNNLSTGPGLCIDGWGQTPALLCFSLCVCVCVCVHSLGDLFGGVTGHGQDSDCGGFKVCLQSL